MLAWIPLVLYAAATIAYVMHFARREPRVGRAATALLAAGVVAHTFLIGMQTVQAGYAPLVGTTAAISAFVWLLGLAYLYVEMTTEERSMGMFVSALLALLAVLPALNPEVEPRPPLLRSPLFTVHVLSMLFAYASFALASVVGITYVLLFKEIKAKHLGFFYSRLPALRVLDVMNGRAITVGWLFLTCGVLVGGIWATQIHQLPRSPGTSDVGAGSQNPGGAALLGRLHVRAFRTTDGWLERAHFLNERRFLSLDLCYGHDVSAAMLVYLLQHGMTLDEYRWFLDHGQRLTSSCVMGNDYYATNEHMVPPGDVRSQTAGRVYGYYMLTRQYFDRYKLPVMHTETNQLGEDDAVSRLRNQWLCLIKLKEDGVPLVGFTWYSLVDQVDWDTGLRENAGRVNPLGLYDLERKIRPVGEAYRELILRATFANGKPTAEYRAVHATQSARAWGRASECK